MGKSSSKHAGSPWIQEQSRSPAAMHRMIFHLDTDASCASVEQRGAGVAGQACDGRFSAEPARWGSRITGWHSCFGPNSCGAASFPSDFLGPRRSTPHAIPRGSPSSNRTRGLLSFGPEAGDVRMSGDDHALASAFGAPASGTASLLKAFATARQACRGGARLTQRTGEALRFRSHEAAGTLRIWCCRQFSSWSREEGVPPASVPNSCRICDMNSGRGKLDILVGHILSKAEKSLNP